MGRPWTARRRLLAALVACLLTALLAVLQIPAARADTPTDSGSAPAPSSAASTGPSSAAAPTSSAPAASTPVTTTVASPNGTTTTTTVHPAAAGTSNGSTVPAPSSTSTGVSVVSGGQPGIPTTVQMPNSSRFRQAVSSFLSGAIGAAPTAIRSMIGQSALTDVSGSSSATRCRCSVALALSVGGSATATAVSGAGPAATAGSAIRSAASTGNGGQSAGQDVPAAEKSGSTGNALSVSVTGHGSATANASTGDSGIPPGPGTAPGAVLTAHNVAISYPLASGAAINLDFALLLDGGTASSTFNVLPCGLQVCGSHVVTATADIAVYAPNGSSCAAVGTEWCTVAVAISVGGPAGSAHATVTRPVGTAAAACTAALVGRPTAVAIGVGGPAQATAHMGAGGGACAPGASAATANPGPVTAGSGNTGNALAVGVTEQGPAGSSATSGNAGTVRAITDSTGPTGTASSAIATTGDTGDAVGISIGKLSASALVRSGSSGRAAALCTHCDLPGGDAIADSYTGRTGGSYALAIAGKQSTANAVSGDSGDAASWAVHGTTAIFQTGQNSTASPDNIVQTGNPGQVYVSGRSGDTGNVVATATDLLTWVSVLTQSGNAGAVISTAKWDADGCSLIFATFTITCTPQTAGQTSTKQVVPSGSQNAVQPVVSAAEQGKIAVARGTAAAIASTSPPRSTASSTPPAGSAPAATASSSGTTGGGGNRTSGHDVKVVGGARTRLASNNSIRSVVSPEASGSLTSWWSVLTLCLLGSFLVALTFVACRHGRPTDLNTG